MFAILVDDAEINNLLMCEALRGVDCEPVSFTKPEEALARLSQGAEDIGVVVTDFEMPGMTGLDLIKAARSLDGFRNVPIVMVTSHDQRRLRRDSLSAGATDFLTKPCDPVEVKARVSNLLALRRALREEENRAEALAREVAAAVSVIEARESEIVARLARAAEHRDTDTGDHVARVSCHVRLIAQRLGYNEAACRKLALASTMHDVGKIAVRDAVLLKPGPLTPLEREEMTAHAQRGHDILDGSASDVVRLAAEIALSHHERWDGAGYPKGLIGSAIPIAGRIVAVADVFDALTSVRPYKKAWSREDALRYIAEGAGAQFDPSCVAAFLAGGASSGEG